MSPNSRTTGRNASPRLSSGDNQSASSSIPEAPNNRAGSQKSYAVKKGRFVTREVHSSSIKIAQQFTFHAHLFTVATRIQCWTLSWCVTTTRSVHYVSLLLSFKCNWVRSFVEQSPESSPGKGANTETTEGNLMKQGAKLGLWHTRYFRLQVGKGVVLLYSLGLVS